MYAQLAPEHHSAIERVIVAMREQAYEPLSLEDMADLAYLSPFHFCRVFRTIIGIPPSEFQSALRLERAKQLLVNTSLSVTDICFEVGYTSLGTFTTRFTRLVGLPPQRLRSLATEFAEPTLDLELPPALGLRLLPTQPRAAGVTGWISTPPDFTGLIFVGLFPRPIPQGIPDCGTILTTPGFYQIAPVPDGRYYLMVAGINPAKRPFASLLSGHDLLVGTVPHPIIVRNGAASHDVNLRLRPPAVTDPPVLISLPLVLVRAQPPKVAVAY